MILDERLEFCDNLDVAVETGTNLVGDVIDLGTATRDIGSGQPMYLVIEVTLDFTDGADSATAQFVLASDGVAGITADGNETRHIVSDTYLKAALVVGTVLVFPLPSGSTSAGANSTYERFLGLEIITATAGFDVGSINAFLTFDPYSKASTSYADATN